MDFDQWNSLGQRLVRSGKITERDLKQAIKKKANGSAHMKIGEILVMMQACSPEDVEAELEAQKCLQHPQVDHEEADRAHEKLNDAIDGLRKTTKRASKTLTMPKWEDSGKVMIG